MKPLDYILILVLTIIIGLALFFTIRNARHGKGCGGGCGGDCSKCGMCGHAKKPAEKADETEKKAKDTADKTENTLAEKTGKTPDNKANHD